MNNGFASAAAVPVLTSWKEIAHYMGKGVRTVQRWEQDFGLPVRRPHGSSKKAILARPHDLDAWVALRCSSRSEQVAHGATALPSDRSAAPASIPTLVAFHARIETARQLCNSNQALTTELRSTLDQLRAELRVTTAVRAPRQPGLTPSTS